MFSVGGALWPFGVTALVGALQVEAETPGALCPPLPTATATLSERLGTVEDDYVLRYSVLHNGAKGETSLGLVMTNAEGQVVLDRRVPLGAEGCESAAQVMAHVVETFFAEQSLNAPATAPGEPQEASGPTEPRGSEPKAGTPATPADVGMSKEGETTAKSNLLTPRVTLGAGAALSFEGVINLALAARIPGPWPKARNFSLYLGGTIPLAAEHTFDATLGTEIGSTSALLFLEVAYRWVLTRPIHLFVGAGALGVVQTAWIPAETGVTSGAGQTRFLLTPSLGVSLAFLIGKNLELGVGALGGPTLTGLASPYVFSFDSSQRDPPEIEVLPPPAFSGLALATLGWRF